MLIEKEWFLEFSTGNSIQYPIITYVTKESGKEWIYVLYVYV